MRFLIVKNNWYSKEHEALILINHMVAYNNLKLQFQGIWCLLWALQCTRQPFCQDHENKQNIHIKQNKKFNFAIIFINLLVQ